jgi:hypothetical protein
MLSLYELRLDEWVQLENNPYNSNQMWVYA